MKWSPLEYSQAAVVAIEAGEEILSRLDWMAIKPNIMIDVGCGTGELSTQLQKRYPQAQLIAFDSSQAMLEQTKNFGMTCICAQAESLPLRDRSVDLIFANFLLPWHANIKQLFREWQRILKPNGLLMLTALGLDTMDEWRNIFVDEEFMLQLIDIHDLGDCLIKEGFADPVLDVNHYTLSYRDKKKLLMELLASGMVMGPSTLLDDLKPTEEGAWSVNYEVIYAHAFAPNKPINSEREIKIPLSQTQLLRTKSKSK